MNKVSTKSKRISKNKLPQLIQLDVRGETIGFKLKQSTIDKVPKLAEEVAISTYVDCDPKIFRLVLKYVSFGKEVMECLDKVEKVMLK